MKKPIKTTFKTIVYVARKMISICDEKTGYCIKLFYEYDKKGNLKNACLEGILDSLPLSFNSFQDVEKAEEIFKLRNRIYAQILALLKEEFLDNEIFDKEKKPNYSNLPLEESIITSSSDSDPIKENWIRTYNASLFYKKTKKDVPIEEVLIIIEKIIIETPGIINRIALMRTIKNYLWHYKGYEESFEIKTGNWKEINRSLVYKINTNQEIPFTIKIEKKQ